MSRHDHSLLKQNLGKFAKICLSKKTMLLLDLNSYTSHCVSTSKSPSREGISVYVLVSLALLCAGC